MGAMPVPEEKNKINAQFRTSEIAQNAAELLQKQFSVETSPYRTVRAGREVYVVEFVSKSLSSFLRSVD